MIADLRALEPPQLKDFTNSLVEQVVAAVTDKIPHLESSLAVAELTVALHYVLNTPEDVLVYLATYKGLRCESALDSASSPTESDTHLARA